MTPAEFELADEQIETAYLRGEIGKITYHRRMSALGYKTEAVREWLRELDDRRRQHEYEACLNRLATAAR